MRTEISEEQMISFMGRAEELLAMRVEQFLPPNTKTEVDLRLLEPPDVQQESQTCYFLNNVCELKGMISAEGNKLKVNNSEIAGPPNFLGIALLGWRLGRLEDEVQQFAVGNLEQFFGIWPLDDEKLLEYDGRIFFPTPMLFSLNEGWRIQAMLDNTICKEKCETCKVARYPPPFDHSCGLRGIHDEHWCQEHLQEDPELLLKAASRIFVDTWPIIMVAETAAKFDTMPLDGIRSEVVT